MAKNRYRDRVREKDVERYLSKNMIKLGGLSYKWRAIDNKGVPDRICMLPWMGVFFAEVKTADGCTTRLQEYMFEKIKNAGGAVYVIYGHEGVDKLVQHLNKIRDGNIPANATP